jgi:Crossover junction endodeoxyribonuclease RuvC.
MIKKIEDKIILGIDPGTRILGFGIIHIKKGLAQFVEMGVVNLIKEKDHFVTLKK